MTRWRSTTLAALAFISSVLVAQQAPTQNPNIPAIIGKIVEVRELTASYVGIANTKFATDPQKHEQAMELYATAYSKYSGWNSQVAAAIRAGKQKNLLNDSDYKTASTEASSAANAFIQYVKTPATAESKAVITIISSLADLGLKIWAGVRKQIDSDRELTAKNFETATKWQKWDDLVKGSANNADKKPQTQP